MVELQEYWSRVLTSRSKIEKASSTLKTLEKELNSMKTSLAASAREIKERKNSLKQDELTLTEMSARKIKLEDRKKIINTEKELQALEKEIDLLAVDISNTEDRTLGQIDELDAMQKSESLREESLKDKEKVISDETIKYEEATRGHQEIIRINEDTFNTKSESLNKLYKSKFLKMVTSKDGVGIARVEGEICGNCHFKIPSFLAIDAGNNDKVVVCTNCGKFIYR